MVDYLLNLPFLHEPGISSLDCDYNPGLLLGPQFRKFFAVPTKATLAQLTRVTPHVVESVAGLIDYLELFISLNVEDSSTYRILLAIFWVYGSYFLLLNPALPGFRFFSQRPRRLAIFRCCSFILLGNIPLVVFRSIKGFQGENNTLNIMFIVRNVFEILRRILETASPEPVDP